MKELKNLICFLIILLLLTIAPLSFAQNGKTVETPTLTQGEDATQKKTEVPPEAKKILVTGSYVRRSVEQKAPTPLSTYDQSRMLETGSYTVADALQESVVFNNVESGAFLSMHGQSSADNLVLLNGLRLPKTAGGSAVNIDFLPATAIERTEILKDGASALYGSEALAGVVNIITKKDFDGANFIARHTSPQQGVAQETTVGLTYGKTWNKSRFLGVLQFKKDDPAFYSETQYGTTDVKLAGSLYSNYANLINSGGNHRDPGCPVERRDSLGRCRFDARALQQIDGKNDREYYTGYLGYGIDVSKEFSIDILTIYTRRSWESLSSPISIDLRNESAFGRPDYSIPKAIVDSWGPVQSANGGAPNINGNSILQYSPLEELGRSTSVRDVDNFITQARSYGEINGWDWEFSVGHGLTLFKDTIVSGNANKQALYDLIINNGFNPMKAPGSKDNLSSVALQTWFEHTSDSLNSKAYTAGPLMQLGPSPLSMAIGVEGQWQSFKFENDPFSLAGIPLTGSASNQQGKRQVYSSFVEFIHSPLKSFDIQIAGRFDEYSDVGSTVNPKLGLSYHATEKVTFRASYGTGFKAPDLLSVFQGQSSGLTSVRDPVICAVDPADPNCNNTLTSVTTFGNRNLEPEKAAHYNIGTVITPQKDLSFVVDYWSVDGEDALSSVTPATILRAESLGVDLSSLGISVDRDPLQGNVVTNITHPASVNAGIFKIRGIDFTVEKKSQMNPFNLGNVNVRFMMEHSHVLSSGGTSFSFDPFSKQRDLNWKNFMSVSFQKEKHFTKMIARTYASGDKNTTQNAGIGLGSTPTYTEYDLHYERFFDNDSSVSLGIKNVFDRTPLNDTAVPGAVFPATSQGNFFGRTFYVGYSQDF